MDWLSLIPGVGSLLKLIPGVGDQNQPEAPTPEKQPPPFVPMSGAGAGGGQSPNPVQPPVMAPMQSPQQAALSSLRQRLGLQ